MIFELNFSTKKSETNRRLVWFFKSDIEDIKEACPSCVEDVTVNNELGRIRFKVNEGEMRQVGYTEITLKKVFRDMITEKETNGYVRWCKIDFGLDLVKE